MNKKVSKAEKVQLIRHPQFGEIRMHAGKKGSVWFCLADVCEVLGLDNPSYVKQRLNSRGGVVLNYPGVVTGKKADGSDAVQVVQMTFIDEPNLYRCIFKSRKVEAVKFQDWVFEEVLPAIRQHGYYVHPLYMEAKDVRRLSKSLSGEMKRYITEEDIVKTGKRFGMHRWDVKNVMMGHVGNNAVMQELQRRAMINKAEEIDAYHPERMQEVIEKLRG